MAFCGYCGSSMPDELNYCTKCGKPLKLQNSVSESSDNAQTQNIRVSENVEDVKSGYTINKDTQSSNYDNANNTNNVRYQGPKYTPEELDYYRKLHEEKEKHEKKHRLYKNSWIIGIVLLIASCIDFYSDPPIVTIILSLVIFVGGLLVFANSLKGKILAGISMLIAILCLLISFQQGMDYGFFVTPEEENANTVASNTSSSSNSGSSSHNPTATSSPSASPSSTTVQTESPKDPKIVGYGGCIQSVSQFSDYAYLDLYYDVYNPNTTLIVQTPTVTTTLRSNSGAILATDSADVGLIMPGDTVRIFSLIQILKSDVSEYSDAEYTLEWGKISKDSGFYNPIRTEEIVFSNVSARAASYSGTVTGDLTNNSDYDISVAVLYAVFLKDGEIVMISDGLTDSIPAGGTRVFEINVFDSIPDYDTIECYIDAW